MPLSIRPATANDCPEWLRMRQRLWPDDPTDDLEADMTTWLIGQQCQAFVAEQPDGQLGAFIEVATRPSDVHGTIGRFAYVEGVYVEPELRRQGVFRALIETAANWGRDQGCSELHSDAHLSNSTSQAAHSALGFEEVNRLVHFRKQINRPI